MPPTSLAGMARANLSRNVKDAGHSVRIKMLDTSVPCISWKQGDIVSSSWTNEAISSLLSHFWSQPDKRNISLVAARGSAMSTIHKKHGVSTISSCEWQVLNPCSNMKQLPQRFVDYVFLTLVLRFKNEKNFRILIISRDFSSSSIFPNTSPDWGWLNTARLVVFPAPLGPRSPKHSPDRIPRPENPKAVWMLDLPLVDVGCQWTWCVGFSTVSK